MNLKIRHMQLNDRAFIFSTWLRGLYYGDPFYKKIDKDAYYQLYPNIIAHLLDKSEVLVACLEDDEDIAIGYCVFENNRVHWIYCKSAFRRQGVAKLLWPKGIEAVSHITKPGDALRRKLGLKFIPFL